MPRRKKGVTRRVIDLKQLTDRQREVWIMRYRYRWRLREIGLELGKSPSTVSRLLQLARARAGVPRGRDIRVIRVKPREVYFRSLSNYSNV